MYGNYFTLRGRIDFRETNYLWIHPHPPMKWRSFKFDHYLTADQLIWDLITLIFIMCAGSYHELESFDWWVMPKMRHGTKSAVTGIYESGSCSGTSGLNSGLPYYKFNPVCPPNCHDSVRSGGKPGPNLLYMGPANMPLQLPRSQLDLTKDSTFLKEPFRTTRRMNEYIPATGATAERKYIHENQSKFTFHKAQTRNLIIKPQIRINNIIKSIQNLV